MTGPPGPCSRAGWSCARGLVDALDVPEAGEAVERTSHNEARPLEGERPSGGVEGAGCIGPVDGWLRGRIQPLPRHPVPYSFGLFLAWSFGPGAQHRFRRALVEVLVVPRRRPRREVRRELSVLQPHHRWSNLGLGLQIDPVGRDAELDSKEL